MKHLLSIVVLLAFIGLSSASAQSVLENKAINAGIGFSGWGVPIYVGLDVPIHEDITIGGVFSYQSYSEDWFGYGWKHTIIGINGRGDYHFNNLLDISPEWDLYSGVSVGYYIWNTKYNDGFGSNISYSGGGVGGVGFSFQAGARYFVSDNFGLNLEFGGGNILSGGRVGITYLLP